MDKSTRSRRRTPSVAQRLAALEARVGIPTTPTRIARGTQDVTTAAAQVVAAAPTPEPEVPLAARIEGLLRQRPRTSAELADEIDDDRLGACIGALRRQRKVMNIGTEATALYVWVIGDQVTTAALRAAIAALCHLRPFTFAELVHVLGANPNRIKGCITDLKLHRYTDELEPLRDFGTTVRGCYYYPPRRETRKRRG